MFYYVVLIVLTEKLLELHFLYNMFTNQQYRNQDRHLCIIQNLKKLPEKYF